MIKFKKNLKRIKNKLKKDNKLRTKDKKTRVNLENSSPTVISR